MSGNTNTPKLALITGATGGIGKATAFALAREGYSLALHYNSASPSAVEDLVSSVSKATKSPSSQTVQAFRADLSDFDAVRSLHGEIVSSMGDPAVVFLNAGTTGATANIGDIADISIDVFETTWRVNTAAPFLLTQLCLPAMERRGWGRVIFNSSVAGITGGVVGGHYASSKSALHGLVHWLAGTVAKKGITVNAIAPALVEDTAMLPDGGSDAMKSKVPVGRFGRPEEMANTVVWMVNTAYLTNKVIAVDGGFSYGG